MFAAVRERAPNGVSLAPNVHCASQDCRVYNVYPYVRTRSKYGIGCMGNTPPGQPINPALPPRVTSRRTSESPASRDSSQANCRWYVASGMTVTGRACALPGSPTRRRRTTSSFSMRLTARVKSRPAAMLCSTAIATNSINPARIRIQRMRDLVATRNPALG